MKYNMKLWRPKRISNGESVHSTVLQVAEGRLSTTTNWTGWGTHGWEQVFFPLSFWYCWGGRQYFRTGLLLFQSILKRLTGGLYLFLLSVAKRLHHILFPIKVIGNSSLLLWSSLRCCCCFGHYLGGNKKNEFGWKRLDHWKIPEVSYQRLHNVWNEPCKNKLRRKLKKIMRGGHRRVRQCFSVCIQTDMLISCLHDKLFQMTHAQLIQSVRKQKQQAVSYE